MTRLDQRPVHTPGFFGLYAFHLQIAHEAKDAFLKGALFAEHKVERFWHNLDAQMQQRDPSYL